MPTINPCSICLLCVHQNHRAMFCNICQQQTHIKCARLSHDDYNILSASADPWFCPACTWSIFPFNHFVDDTDYYFAIYDLQRISDPQFDITSIKTKHFNPFLEDPDSRQLLLNSDLDPDTNLFVSNSNILSKCPYFTSKEFHNLYSIPTDSFSLFHLNIRSLKKHSENLSEYLQTLKKKSLPLAFLKHG